MKTIVISLLFFATFWSCNNDQQTGSEASSNSTDTTASAQATAAGGTSSPGQTNPEFKVDSNKVMAISAAAQQLDAEIIQTKIGKGFRPVMYSDKDAVNYAVKDGKLIRVVADMSIADTMITRSYFYFDNDKFTFVRLREWHKLTPTWARELQVYYENGDIHYAMERTVQLQPGEGPGPLLNVPLAECTRSKKAIAEEIDFFWLPTKKAVDAEMKK